MWWLEAVLAILCLILLGMMGLGVLLWALLPEIRMPDDQPDEKGHDR